MPLRSCCLNLAGSRVGALARLRDLSGPHPGQGCDITARRLAEQMIAAICARTQPCNGHARMALTNVRLIPPGVLIDRAPARP